MEEGETGGASEVEEGGTVGAEGEAVVLSLLFFLAFVEDDDDEDEDDDEEGEEDDDEDGGGVVMESVLDVTPFAVRPLSLLGGGTGVSLGEASAVAGFETAPDEALCCCWPTSSFAGACAGVGDASPFPCVVCVDVSLSCPSCGPFSSSLSSWWWWW